MKYIALLALLLSGQQSFTQEAPGNAKTTYAMVINGKIFSNGAVVPKDDLKHLPGLLIINLTTKKQYKPNQFEWVVTQKGQVTKSESTNHDNWDRLPGLLEHMDDKAIIFVNEIKLDPPVADFPGYFYLKTR